MSGFYYEDDKYMLETLERIWPGSERNKFYWLIAMRKDYLMNDGWGFALMFEDAVTDYDYGIKKYDLWGRLPGPNECLGVFIVKVLQAVVKMFECSEYHNLREHIYNILLDNCRKIYFPFKDLDDLDKVIAENEYLKVVSNKENSEFDYSLPLGKFLCRYSENDLTGIESSISPVE